MTLSNRTTLIQLVTLSLVVCAASDAWAVRPFVTDDARIIEKGQIEVETWPELQFERGRARPGYNLMAGVTITDWLELIMGAGVALGEGNELAVANPVFQPKFLIWNAETDGLPGLAVGTGITLPVGRGELFEEATGVYVIGMLSSRLFDDWLFIHLNLGATSAIIPASEAATREVVFKPYWGIGIEAGVVWEELRFIAEAYSGDPFEALGPDYAFQSGFRWLASDHFNLDLTLGAQPLVEDRVRVSGEWEFWAQIGVRLLFDVFTKGPGDPMGAPGMIKAPWR